MTPRWPFPLSLATAWLVCEAAFGGSTATCLRAGDPFRHHSAEYLAKVHTLIEPVDRPFLQMRVDPSFDQDHSVCLHGTPRGASWTTAKHFFVSHYIADRNIGYSLPSYHNGRSEKVSVTVTTAELPRPIAERVYDVWRRMLRRAGHPEEVLLVDPTTVEFSFRDSQGPHYAEAYEPHACDDSYLLSQVGRGLIACCHPEKFSPSWALKLLEKRTQAAEKFLRRDTHD